MSTQQFQGKVEMLGGVDLKGASEGVSGIRRKVEAITNAAAVTRTLNTEESGTLFQIDVTSATNAITLTLPTAASSAGVYYDFTVQANSHATADFVVTTGLDATDIYGGIVTLDANSTVDAFNGVSKKTLDGSVAQSSEGFRMQLLCDGTNWHLSGHIATAVGTVHLVGAASA